MSLGPDIKARAVDGHIELFRLEDSMPLAELQVVPATTDHRNFILATWVRSYASTARKFMGRKDHSLFDGMVAEKLWTRCRVATSDGFTVQAWACIEGPVLHHCYVIPEMRGRGMLRALLRIGQVPVTTISRPWPREAGLTGTTYNPFLIQGVLST